jgi:hypothetical protein
MQRLIACGSNRTLRPTLTNDTKDVLRLVAAGLSAEHIAERLGLAVADVDALAARGPGSRRELVAPGAGALSGSGANTAFRPFGRARHSRSRARWGCGVDGRPPPGDQGVTSMAALRKGKPGQPAQPEQANPDRSDAAGRGTARADAGPAPSPPAALLARSRSSLTPSALLAVQRNAGNRGAVSLLGVQRDDGQGGGTSLLNMRGLEPRERRSG